MSKLLIALAATLSVAATSAQARAFTVDDLLHQASFGRTAIDPSGRWVVFEQRDPYDSLDRYDHNLQGPTALSRLRLADTRTPSEAHPLLAGDPRGVVMGPFSPSGARLAVFRWRGEQWALGIAEIATGSVRWFPITPEAPVYGRTVQWRNENELLVIDRADGSLPWPLRGGRLSAERLPQLWARQARGEAAVTVIGSGAFIEANSARVPRRLVRVAPNSGATETLATGAFRDLEISPDGRRMALFETGLDLQPRAGGPAQGPAGISTEAHHLRLLDLATGSLTRPTADADLLPHLMSWSPSGAALIVYARGADGLWPNGRLLRVDAKSGRTVELGDGLIPALRLRPDNIATGWMGETPVLKARRPGGARVDWWRLSATGPINLTQGLPTAPEHLRAIAADGALAIVGERAWRLSPGGQATLLPGRYVPLRKPATTQDGRIEGPAPEGSWAVEIGGSGRLRWMTAKGPKDALDLPDVEAGQVGPVSRASKTVLWTEQAPAGPERLHLRRGGVDTALAALNDRLAETDAPRVVPVSHKGREGQPLTSWLFLPAGPLRNPPPLVVRVYAGASYPTAPKDTAFDRGFVANLRMLTGHGYAVLVPSLPLPTGTGDPMPGLADRILLAVDAAAASPQTAGTFDHGRIAILGHSYGGYTTMAAIVQTHRFQAAVAISGISNLITNWEYQPAVHRPAPEEGLRLNWSTGYTEASQGGMGVPPWSDPARYIRNSPIFAADKIETPLLLLHGDQDVVSLDQSEAMFSALFRQSKDAQLVTYWGEGHGIMSPGNVRDMYTRIFDFLDARLEVAR